MAGPKLSITNAPAPAAAIACVLIFVLGFLCLDWLPGYLARQHLAVRAEIMLVGLQELAKAARSDVMSLPSLTDLKCHSGLSPVLSRQEFQNPYIRWFAVASARQVVCASMTNPTLDSEDRIRRLDDVWSVRVEKDPKNGDSFVLMQNRGDLEYMAILDPILFNFESSLGCVNCISYEAVILGNPELVVRSGNARNQAVIRVTTRPLANFSNLRLTVAATQEYVDGFRLEGRLLAAIIAAPVALLLSFLLYGYLVRRMSIGNLIRQGLRRHEFVTYYQPIVDARDGSVLGAEALVRWRRNRELIPPSQFIDFAEESGLIDAITDQLILNILADLSRLGWLGTPRRISINVVPDQITDSQFCEMLVAKLAEKRIPGKNLAIEITERRKLHNLAEGGSRLLRLAAVGIDIMIDDAGTGFGGFSYVQELPVSTLKIDKMFIDTLKTEGDAKSQVLDAIIHFGKESGLHLIAEGVETHEQIAYLLRSGVHAIQGNVYARPMPVGELARWMEAFGLRKSA